MANKYSQTISCEAFLDELSSAFQIQVQEESNQNLILFDTFDWRLFSKGILLARKGEETTARKFKQEIPFARFNSANPPVFAEDFPLGSARDTIKSALKMRALIPIAGFFLQKKRINICNNEQKTLARIELYQYFSHDNEKDAPIHTEINLSSLKGYEKAFNKTHLWLLGNGFVQKTEKDLYFDLLKAGGAKPGGYSSKFEIQLLPHLQSEEAARKILAELLKSIEINKRYIASDIDTEFLHDFRVAIRRSRSALSQIKYVFPEEDTQKFKNELAYFGKLTNNLRDLDVYLLKEQEYKDMLPANIRDDIKPLFDFLRSKRKIALNRVCNNLKSEQFKYALSDWSNYLKTEIPTGNKAKNAEMPILELAKKRIAKKYKYILNEGFAILNNQEDELLHALRIDCKKLRYLLEFFQSLFPPEQINILIKQLKNLQDNLGDFNDLCVQQDYLEKVGMQLPVKSQASKKAIIAIGSLVGALNIKKQEVKSEFANRFKVFSSTENQFVTSTLFNNKIKKEL